MTEARPDLRFIGSRFEISGDFAGATPYGSGHINDTYAATYRREGRDARYIHQRINRRVFRDPAALMENIERVTAHQAGKLRAAGHADPERRALTVVPSRDGRAFCQDAEGGVWRTYLFIEGARTYDSIQSSRQAREAARAFGEFQRQLSDLPPSRLHETIPNFHQTPKRLEALARAIDADAHNRARHAQPEIAFIQRRQDMTRVLEDQRAAGHLPERIAHNDTKLNNVMLDDATQEGVCVIDLDTVMPGLALHDFGDMVRTATSPRPEDERDLSLIRMQMPMFAALVDGYLASAGGFLTPLETELLAFSGKLITLEIGIRFLTDYLQGDVYFKSRREGQNLDRCRAQLRLVASIEEQEDEMRACVARAVAR